MLKALGIKFLLHSPNKKKKLHPLKHFTIAIAHLQKLFTSAANKKRQKETKTPLGLKKCFWVHL